MPRHIERRYSRSLFLPFTFNLLRKPARLTDAALELFHTIQALPTPANAAATQPSRPRGPCRPARRVNATYRRRAALQNSQARCISAPIFPRVFPKPSVQYNRPILTTSAATASPLKVMRPRQIKQLTHRPQPQSLMAYTKRSPLPITPPQHRHDGLSTSSQYRPNRHNAIMS